MKTLVLLALVMLGAVVQSKLPAWACVGAPVLLSIVLYHALSTSGEMLFWACLWTGFFQDSLGLMPLGYSVFSYGLAGWLMAKLRDSVYESQWITHVVLGAVAAFGTTLLTGCMLLGNGDLPTGFGRVLLCALGSALYGAVVTPLALALLRGFHSVLGLAKERGTGEFRYHLG